MRVVILEEWIQILKDLQLRLYGTGQFNFILLLQKNCWNELLKAKLDIVDFLPMSKKVNILSTYTFNSKYRLCGGD